jgi:hypothetical protein
VSTETARLYICGAEHLILLHKYVQIFICKDLLKYLHYINELGFSNKFSCLIAHIENLQVLPRALLGGPWWLSSQNPPK